MGVPADGDVFTLESNQGGPGEGAASRHLHHKPTVAADRAAEVSRHDADDGVDLVIESDRGAQHLVAAKARVDAHEARLDLGARELLDRRHLGGIGARGHEDFDRGAEPGTRPGDGGAVVAARGRDEAARGDRLGGDERSRERLRREAKAAAAACISIGSPSSVPVPWASR